MGRKKKKKIDTRIEGKTITCSTSRHFFSSLNKTEEFCAVARFSPKELRDRNFSILFGENLAKRRLFLQLLNREIEEKRIELHYVEKYYNAITSDKRIKNNNDAIRAVKKQLLILKGDYAIAKIKKIELEDSIKKYIEEKEILDADKEKRCFVSHTNTKEQTERSNSLIDLLKNGAEIPIPKEENEDLKENTALPDDESCEQKNIKLLNLQPLEKALKRYNIPVINENGDLRETQDIFKQLKEKWDEILEEDKAKEKK